MSQGKDKVKENENKIEEKWTLVKVLGSGGFGIVTLWCDPSTGQKIAIKKLLEDSLKDPSVKIKVRERWCNEVEIMKKLSHKNVIATLDTPLEFLSTDGLPVLAMEFCSSGDLRQVLNLPRNSCGLQENEVVDIVRDISSGLAYLHSCKIIHRDIKPENIVLEEKDSRTIYKLIDLGYAKALDQSSLSKSFVGTIQYIAPELFMGKAYTCSVDYWSFGLMTHEIMTGSRPFLPDRTPSDWMKQIQNKNRNIVSVSENDRGQVVFSSSISRNNASSRCFLEDMEKWFQVALDWDGQLRGRDLKNNRLVIFDNLTDIICKTVIKIFSLATFETLSFEVGDETDIYEIRTQIKNVINIEEEDQLLLLPSGKCLSLRGNLFKNVDTQKLDRSQVSIYVYSSGLVNIKTDKIKLGNEVEKCKEEIGMCVSYKGLRRCLRDFVYFMESMASQYRNFLLGIQVKITHTKQKTLAIESLYEELENSWNKIEYYGHFLSFSHKIDLENYIHFRKAGKLKSSPYVRKWIKNVIDVNNKITELKGSFNKTKQRQLMLLAKQRCRVLDDHSSSSASHRTPLDALVEKGYKLWETLCKSSKSDGEVPMYQSYALELLDKTWEQTNKFLQSLMIVTLFTKIWEADENLAKFLTQLKNLSKSMEILHRVLEHTQAERQKEVWALLASANSDSSSSSENSNSGSVKDAGEKVEVHSNGGSDDFSVKELKKKEIGSNLSLAPFSLESDSLAHIQGLSSVIDDNNHLRYRIQEAQQSCNKLMDEISALKWDFMLESE